ncbi:hypothetical protein QUC31_016078 [Theobroma cacao]|uniref:Uncharacterized protein n=1 Tax=Theobroma cacao TaxID=3641 RepID=A0A061EPP1_THECC|nr:Uncharacterized protein TCM_021428 [Theobroma cacao]WRX20024.1 hypothetical protein QQP08_012511 [Theobroma cacao]
MEEKEKLSEKEKAKHRLPHPQGHLVMHGSMIKGKRVLSRNKIIDELFQFSTCNSCVTVACSS